VALSDEDEVGIHYEDTLRAGDGLCNEQAVRVLVQEGPKRIMELISWGAEFDKEGSKLAFGLEAAHTRKRILHSHGDATGKELERVLISKVRTLKEVSRLPFSTAVELLVREGVCLGALVLRDRRVQALLARATVLATGGAGQVYAITTNPQVATGDGIALAYRAGAELQDMEFVQFHPTSLYLPSAPHFLLTEAMRGEGGVLRNTRGEAFMRRYHRQGELAPRDVVSRAILQEMHRLRSEHVYLDMTHLGEGFLRRRFPRIYDTCLRFGLDIAKEPIPVCPAAHYMMGGVRTDLWGRTSLKGLLAAGEVACTGVHGANRLASNSLLEGLVYGYRAGLRAPQEALTQAELRSLSRGVALQFVPYSIPAHDEIRGQLRRLMWQKVGIIRHEEGLKEARRRLSRWQFILQASFLTRRELELKNMLQVAMLISQAALQRRESIGAHYRADHPHRSPHWRRHLLWQKDRGGFYIKAS
jgi:L-aspartate oxidase